MDTLFISLFILLPAVTFVLLHQTGFSLNRIGLPQFVVISCFLFSFMGTLPLYFGWDDYRISIGITNRPLIFEVMLYSGFSMINLSLGAIVAKTVVKKPAILETFSFVRINHTEKLFILIGSLIVIFVLYLYLSQISNIALFVALFENISDAKVSRSLMGNDFSGNYHWYRIIIRDFANILTFSFFAIYLISKKTMHFLFFLILFSISAFSSLMTIEKSPIAWLLIGLFLVHVLIEHNGTIKLTKILLLISVIIAIMIGGYIFLMGISEPERAFTHLISRAFAGSIQPAYHYLEFFPEQSDFLLGSSFPNPGGFLPYQPYDLTKEIMMWVNPYLADQGIVGSMPTVFWGEAYANFGPFGLVFIPFFIGFLLYSMDILFSLFLNTPLKIGVYVWTLVHYKSLAITGFSKYLVDITLIIIIAGFLLMVLFSNNFKLKLKKLRY